MRRRAVVGKQAKVLPLAKSRTDEQGAALAQLDAAIDTRLPTTASGLAKGMRAMRADAFLTDELVGALWDTGSVSRDLRQWAERQYGGLWDRFLATPIKGAQIDAERDLGLEIGASNEDFTERSRDLPRVLAASQATAWRIARAEAVDLGFAREDGLEILRAVSGMNRDGVIRVVRGQGQRVAKLRPSEEWAPRVKDSMAKKVRASVLRHVDELLRRRAHLTAEYELARGYNAAQRLAVIQAMKIGLVTEVTREWVTQRDEDVCPVCAPLHGRTQTARAARTLYTGWAKGLPHPPAHIRCRCTEIYRVS